MREAGKVLFFVLVLCFLGCNPNRGDKTTSCPGHIRSQLDDFRTEAAPMIEKYAQHERLEAVEAIDLESRLRALWRAGKCEFLLNCNYNDEIPEGMETEAGKKLAVVNPECAEGLRIEFWKVGIKLKVLSARNVFLDEEPLPATGGSKQMKTTPVSSKKAR